LLSPLPSPLSPVFAPAGARAQEAALDGLVAEQLLDEERAQQVGARRDADAEAYSELLGALLGVGVAGADRMKW
jgi:hypothetical protein